MIGVCRNQGKKIIGNDFLYTSFKNKKKLSQPFKFMLQAILTFHV